MKKETKVKNPVGRPNTTAQEQAERCETARKYLLGDWKEFGDVIPSLAGLACYMGKTRETIYAWRDADKNFSDIVLSILAMQERQLLNGGLSGDYNATISKLVLSKHGYSDKVEQDVTSSDGSMTPKAPVYKIVT